MAALAPLAPLAQLLDATLDSKTNKDGKKHFDEMLDVETNKLHSGSQNQV